MLRVLLLTGLALFAANSILARLALAPGTMDAWSYTGGVAMAIVAGERRKRIAAAHP